MKKINKKVTKSPFSFPVSKDRKLVANQSTEPSDLSSFFS